MYYNFQPTGYPIKFRFRMDEKQAAEILPYNFLSTSLEFPAYIDSLSTDFSPSWNTYTENGRAEPKVLLNQFSKTVSVSFKVVAETTKRNTVSIFKKLELLVKYATPHYYPGKVGYQGKFLSVTIGNVYVEQIMIINSIQYNWNNSEMNWSVGTPVTNEDTDIPGKLPMWADVSIDFTWIGREIPSQHRKSNYFMSTGISRPEHVRPPRFSPARSTENIDISQPYFPTWTPNSLATTENRHGFVFKFSQHPGDRSVEFPALLDDISANFNSEWETYPEIARADPKYRINQFTKTLSISFKVVAESDLTPGRTVIDCFNDLENLARMATPYYQPGAGDTSAYKGYDGSFISFTIGNLYVDEVGYITSLSYNWDNTQITWDTGTELPILTEVNMTIAWVGRGMSQTSYKYFGHTFERYREWTGYERVAAPLDSLPPRNLSETPLRSRSSTGPIPLPPGFSG